MRCYYSSTFFEEQASLIFRFTRLSWVKSCFTMFSCVVDFTHQLYFPLIFTTIEIVSLRLSRNFYLKTMRSKTPAKHKDVGSWLHFYATIGFTLSLERAYYVILQEATTSIFLLLYHEDASNYPAMVICDDFCLGVRNTSQCKNQTFFTVNCKKQWQQWLHLHCNEQATTTTFFTLHCKGVSKNNKNSNISRRKCKLQGYDDGRSPMQQLSFFRCCRLKWWWQWACSTRGNNNKHILNVASQEKWWDNIFDVARSSRIARGHATKISQQLQDVRTQQSNFYMMSITMMMAMGIFL